MQHDLDTNSGQASSESQSSNTEDHRSKNPRLSGLDPGMSLPAFSGRSSWSLERSLIDWVYERAGRPQLTIALWDGTIVGDSQSSVGRILISHPGVLRRLFWNPSLAFGECYSEGNLLIQGDIRAVLLEVNRGLTRARSAAPKSRGNTRFTSRSHSLAKSKSSVHHHYDLGKRFLSIVAR